MKEALHVKAQRGGPQALRERASIRNQCRVSMSRSTSAKRAVQSQLNCKRPQSTAVRPPSCATPNRPLGYILIYSLSHCNKNTYNICIP